MNIISRHCINPKILVHVHNHETHEYLSTHNYDSFCQLIDRWKTILVEKYNVKPGQTIYAGCGPSIFYYALLFASAELGLVFIVDWPHAYSERDLTDPKMALFGKIDFIATTKFLYDADNPQYLVWDIKRNEMYGNCIIFEDDFHTYEIQDQNLHNSMATTIWATPDSNLISSCSSGTTGLPKKFTNSHRKVYLMGERIGRICIQQDKKVLHTAMLHHGASLCYHFLPGFMFGGEQYTFSNGIDYQQELNEFVNQNKINHLFLFTPSLVLTYLKTTAPVTHQVNIVTLYHITADMLPLIKEKNINFIKTCFGDTTIGVGFFIKTADQQTDPVEYDVTNMGAKLDDFFQFDIRENRLYVSCPELNEDWRTSNDVFEIINGNYHFHGRADQYRINGEWVQLRDIELKVKELFGLNGANIVIDNEMQKIYLAIWKNNPRAELELSKFFSDNYKAVSISYTLRDQLYEQFVNSRKIDNSKLRQFCREVILKKGIL